MSLITPTTSGVFQASPFFGLQEHPLFRSPVQGETLPTFEEVLADGNDLYWDVVKSTLQTPTATTPGNGDLVATISDISGQNNTGTAPYSYTRATYVADDGDGYPCLDSNNDYYDAATGWTDVTEETYFMVVKVVSPIATSIEGLFGSNTNDNHGAYHSPGTPNVLHWTTSASTANAVGSIRDVLDGNIGSKYKILRFRRKVGTGRDGFIEIFENGRIMMRDTHSTGSQSCTIRWGARGTSAGIVKMRAFIHFNKALTETQCQVFEAHLNSEYNVFSLPAWCENSLPQVQRYAIANNIALEASMPKKGYVASLAGDSTVVSFAPNSEFDVKYIKAFTDAYIYEWNIANAWELLDTTDTASANNKAMSQGYAGHEATLAWEINNQLSEDAYIMKYGISGAHLENDSAPNNWNIDNLESEFPTRFRRFMLQALNKEALAGTNLINLGIVIHLGTNDADESGYATIASNLTKLINFFRDIPGLENSKVAICEIFSTSASYPRITEARQALVDVANSLPNCSHINGMDAVGDTTDNTHPSGATYTAMASTIMTFFTS